MDAKGNTALVSGTILSIDVWSKNGVKYFVEFNDLCQPIRKGGHILIRFIGMMANMETHCPVGEEDWHAIDSHIKGQYRFSLKKEYYKLKEKTLDEMCSQDDVNAKVEQLRLKYPTKSQLELENEAFEEIMYQYEIPDRLVGYELGVKKGDIYGVHGVLRKEGYGKIQRNIVMDSFKEEMVALVKKNDKLE
ncbi:Potassium voltage-gated channel subfamily S member 2 [Bienertia sinuspersici]